MKLAFVNISRRVVTVLLALVILNATALSILAPKVNAAYKSNYLISDSTFENGPGMGVTQIQNFLLGLGSGLASYHDVENCGSTGGAHYAYYSTYYNCGHSVLAAQIIYDSARAYNINAKAILATMQKEQSLVTDPSPGASQLNCAMGYNSCSGFSGFFLQVDNGAWQFRTYIELMSGRNWWGYAPSDYPCKTGTAPTKSYPSGNNPYFYSPGLYPGNNVTFYDYYGTAYTHFVIGNASTAALYCYTPHVYPGSAKVYYSGSYNFVYWFEQWFGSTTSPCYSDSNVTGASGKGIIDYQYNAKGQPSLAYMQTNNTGSHCAEVHVWNSGYKSWLTHIVTGMPPTVPNGNVFVTGNLLGHGKDDLAYLRYAPSGFAEVHIFSPDLKTFPGYYDVASNLSNISPTSGTFVTGNFDGAGRDELTYVRFKGSGGNAEIHKFSSDFKKAIGIYDVPTNLGSVTSTSGAFVAGDFLGRGYDQLVYVKYSSSGGNVEIHMFSKDLRKAIGVYDVGTNLGTVTANSGKFVAGDFLGRGYDQLMYVKYGVSGGKVETHLFSQDLRKGLGIQDLQTNLGGFDPSL